VNISDLGRSALIQLRRISGVAFLSLGLASSVPGFANTLTVANARDSGPGSLRNAIATASPGDKIAFSITGTINLTSGPLKITQNLTITGPGAANLTISGNQEFTIFIVDGSGSRPIVTISGLTIQGGGGANSGGGVANTGVLTLKDCVVWGNDLLYPSDGAGILNSSGATLTLNNCTVFGNSAEHGSGGGIANEQGTVILTNSTVSNNSASEEAGGGIYNGVGTLTVTNSTISLNSASFGGGIANQGPLTLVNSTIADNSATQGAGAGLSNLAPSFIAKGNVFANGGSGGNCALDGGPVTSLGYNISDDNTCASAFNGTDDENSVVKGAGLNPDGLENNGGPTETMALLPDSPAVNHIPLSDCTDQKGNRIATDQRGVTRPQGSACDSGAFELGELTGSLPFSGFKALLAIETGQHSAFGLRSWFSVANSGKVLDPISVPVALRIANYTVNVPAGSFRRLWDSSSSPYIYEGTIDGTRLVMGLIPRASKNYEFTAIGSPVVWHNVTNPVTVSLTIGTDSGTTSVKAFNNHSRDLQNNSLEATF
jgi:hypothetical protein